MSLLKTAAVVALSSTLAFAGTAMADHQGNDKIKHGVSFMYGDQVSVSSLLGGGFLLGYIMEDSHFEAGLNVGIAYENDDDETFYTLGGLLGFRKSLRQNIFGSLGLDAEYTMVSHHSSSDGDAESSYRVAPYLGLSYEPKSSLQLFVRLMPVSYTSLDTDTHSITFFQQGQIGMSYFFNA